MKHLVNTMRFFMTECTNDENDPMELVKNERQNITRQWRYVKLNDYSVRKQNKFCRLGVMITLFGREPTFA